MTSCRFRSHLLASALLVAILLPGCSRHPSITGEWSQTSPRDHVPNDWLFRPDGSATVTNSGGDSAHFSYVISDSGAVTFKMPPQTPPAPDVTGTVEWQDGDHFTLRSRRQLIRPDLSGYRPGPVDTLVFVRRK